MRKCTVSYNGGQKVGQAPGTVPESLGLWLYPLLALIHV